MTITELSDSRFVGLTVFEIKKVPFYETLDSNLQTAYAKNKDIFTRVINETHRLCASESVSIELLWLSEPIADGRFAAKLRLFCVLRKIGGSSGEVSNALESLHKTYVKALEAQSYSVSEINTDDYARTFKSISKSNANAIVKSEKITGGLQSVIPYYFCDLLPDVSTNFSTVFDALCYEPNTTVSLSIIPTIFTENEINAVAQIEDILKQVKSGIGMQAMGMYRDMAAEQPSDTYSYYLNKINQPLFTYNILIMGNVNSCAGITSKIMSQLQTGENRQRSCDLINVPLNNEDISLLDDVLIYPWNINGKLVYSYRNMELWSQLSFYEPILRLPFVISSEEAAAFFRLPIDDKETPGLIGNRVSHNIEQLRDTVTNKNNIRFGVLAGSDDVSIGAPELNFTQHALIVGTPGTGKTTFSINLLLQFAKRNIPFLAIEPTKTEYRAMIDAISGLQIFTPGNAAVSPYIINPFIPPKGVRIEQYIPSLASAFKAAFAMFTPLDLLFLRAVKECYSEYGWKDGSRIGDTDVTVFGLYEFILVFKRMVSETKYSAEYRGQIESAGFLRLANLIEQNSNIYDNVNTVPIEDLLSKPTVLELNAIDNSEFKALIMALLLISTCVYTKYTQSGEGELKNVILIDEAHVLLAGTPSKNTENAAPEATTVKALQDMIAEIRSYGTSIIIADQSPSKVSREVVANTDIKISFRLVQSTEKALIADSMNMDEQTQQQLSRLKRGEAFVYYIDLDDPQLIITEDIRKKEGIRLSVSDNEITERSTYWTTRQKQLKPYAECRLCPKCNENCDFSLRQTAEYLSSKLLRVCKNSLRDKETLKKYIVSVPKLMEKDFAAYDANKRERLIDCVKVKFLRKAQLETPITLNATDIKQAVAQKG